MIPVGTVVIVVFVVVGSVDKRALPVNVRGLTGKTPKRLFSRLPLLSLFLQGLVIKLRREGTLNPRFLLTFRGTHTDFILSILLFSVVCFRWTLGMGKIKLFWAYELPPSVRTIADQWIMVFIGDDSLLQPVCVVLVVENTIEKKKKKKWKLLPWTCRTFRRNEKKNKNKNKKK